MTLREERKVRVFVEHGDEENIRSRRDEVRGEWRRLHNEKLNDMYP